MGRGLEDDAVAGEEGGDEAVDEGEVGVVPGKEDEDGPEGRFADVALKAFLVVVPKEILASSASPPPKTFRARPVIVY